MGALDLFVHALVVDPLEAMSSHFVAQIEMMGQAFGIEPGGVDLPTFPPFALFDPALGLTSVIPDMDPTRPAV